MTGETLRLGLLEGDGIGAEIVPPAVEVVEAALAAAGAPAVEWVTLPVGRSAIDSHGSPIPDETLKALSDMDAWLLGPHDSAAYPEPHESQLNPSGRIRKHFGLFANIRPAASFDGAKAVVPDIDLVIVRENTQGFYADRNTFAGTGEYMPDENTAIAMCIVTRSAVEKIARVAFDLAQTRRRRLTIVHKANVLRLTTGLFRDVCREIAVDYPDVEVDDHHIDAMAAHLVRRANEFDVIVTENMFGDILSDLAGELAGSLGIAPSINASLDQAMAQAAHGSAPDIAGRNIANPIAMILSSGMLLHWLGSRRGDTGLLQAAELIESGVAATVRAGIMTSDMGGGAGTREFGAAVAAAISSSRAGM